MLNTTQINVLVCAGLIGCIAQAHSSTWSLTEIGSLGGEGRTWANSINNSRQIVGSSPTASGDGHAFLYSNGQMQDLGTLGSGRSSTAAAINNHGQIVGSSSTGEINYYGRAVTRPFVYSNDTMTAVPTEGYASDISDSGFVTGSSSSQPGIFQASLYNTHNGQLMLFGDPNLEWSGGYAVNNNGQVVGGYSSELSNRASFYYDANNGSIRDIDPLGRDYTTTVDINEAGQAVGTAFYSGPDGGYSTAYLYQNGVNTALDNPFGLGSAAGGINASGQIVGTFQIDGDQYGGLWHAFFYGSNGWVDLNEGITLDDGAYLYRAVALNDLGDVIAYGSDGSNYLLTWHTKVQPVPEAETWALLLTGLGLTGFMARRKRRGVEQAAVEQAVVEQAAGS